MHTHIVDIGRKPSTFRRAIAQGKLLLQPETLRAIERGDVPKGDVLTVAQVAGLQAIKRTPDWLPLCHPLPVTKADVALSIEQDHVSCTVTVETTYATGVEMEALCGVSAALLTVWDMTKALEKDDTGNYPDTRLVDIHVVDKHKAEPRTTNEQETGDNA